MPPFALLFSPCSCTFIPDEPVDPLADSPCRLFFLSGLPTAEKPAAQKSFLLSYPADKTDASSNIHDLRPQNDSWAQYKAYLARTSIFFPIPPSVYRPLPEFIKRTILLDLPMYKFDEEKDGRKALEEERKKNRHEV